MTDQGDDGDVPSTGDPVINLTGEFRKNLANIPMNSPEKTGIKLLSKEKGAIEVNKNKLTKRDLANTRDKLAELLIHSVVKKKLYLEDRACYNMTKPIIDWLRLHKINNQLDSRTTTIFWTLMNVQQCLYKNVLDVVDALKGNITDILTEAAAIMSQFSPRFISKETDFLALIDQYKKIERYLQTPGTKSGKRNFDEGSKMPVLNIPTYNGRISDADSPMKDIFMEFQVHSLNDYLTDEHVCKENQTWSQAFVTAIAQSIMHNGKLSHLAEDVDETNCARYYSALASTIYTIENKMCHMNSTWKKLLSLATEDEVSFLTFYSSFTKHMRTLKAGNSPIANDNSFIRMFLHNAIDIKSLKALSHELLTKHHIQPLVISEKMKKLISTSNVFHEMRNK